MATFFGMISVINILDDLQIFRIFQTLNAKLSASASVIVISWTIVIVLVIILMTKNLSPDYE